MPVPAGGESRDETDGETPDLSTVEFPKAGHREPGQSAFAAGELVAGRYRIVRFIARGGMGEVYEARDLELDGPVALKTIRPRAVNDAIGAERFKREIQMARKVTHPNVCRLFEFGSHAGETGAEDRVLFLTMELLEGETLAEFLERRGRMSEQEALPLLRQIAEGLQAAHEAGVVHRDLKSSNVLLVPSKKGLRAVVTDFGLARSSDTGLAEEDPSLTGSRMVVGTPATMAPEQFTGGPIGPATDVYAFGLLLYEMLTGRLPFSPEMPAAVYRRLHDPAPSPRLHVPGLDERWEAAVLRCLELRAENRFQNVTDLVRALEEPQAPPARPVELRRAVAVLGFKNLAGRADTAWLSTALAEMLGTELAAGEKLRIVPGEDVARMKIELALGDPDGFGRETLLRVRANLGADLLVLGSYVALGERSGGQLRLDLRLQDAAAGETLALVKESGTEAGLFELVSRIGARLRERLGVAERSEAEAEQVRAALPRDPEAMRLYAEGLEKLRLFDAAAARVLLEKAVAAEPDHALARRALAEARAVLEPGPGAIEEARKAFELSAGLSREERLLSEATWHKLSDEHEKALEIYRALFTFFPDNVDHGVRLALHQHSARRQQDAAVTLEALRQLPAPASEDLNIDLAEAVVAMSLQDYRRSRNAAARAAEKARARGASLLAARARFHESRALKWLGDLDEAEAAAREARQMFAANSNRHWEAEALEQLGELLCQRGALDEALQMFRDSLALHRAVGCKHGAVGWLLEAAWVFLFQGKLDEALRLQSEFLAQCIETGDEHSITHARHHGATLIWRQGKLAEARRISEELLPIFVRLEDRNCANSVLMRLGHIFMSQGDLVEARKRLMEVLGFSEKDARPVGRNWAVMALTRLCLEEGRAVEAEELAREALAEFQQADLNHGLCQAQALLARALLAQGRRAEAQQAAEQAEALSGRAEMFMSRLDTVILAAPVRAAGGSAEQVAASIESLERVAAEAARNGFLGFEFEATLALGELEVESGRTEAGLARLEALAQEASARGFVLIASKAAAAARRAGGSI